MNDAELIDTLLGTTSLGERLLKDWGSLPSIVKNLDAAKLTPTQRIKLQAALQIRFIREDEVKSVMCPSDIFEIVKDLQAEPQEHLVVLVFNVRSYLLHRENLYKGNVNTTQIRIAEILRPAIIRRANAITLVHNHPSGDPTPSADDVAFTRATNQACRIMDISLMDHIIVGHDRWISLKERGLGFG